MPSTTILARVKRAKTKERLPLAIVYAIAQELIKKLGLRGKNPFTLKPEQKFIKDRIIIGGSLRRKAETIGDIDLLCTYNTITEDQLRKITGIHEIWGSATKQLYFDYTSDSGIWRPVNIWFCQDPSAFGAFLVHVTGSKKFNVMLRSKAKYKGITMNQYGLFDTKTHKYLAGATEQDVFKAVHEEWIDPSKRDW